MRVHRPLALALAFFALALAPLATAQVPQPTLSIRLDKTDLALGAGNQTDVAGTVTFSDSVPSSSASVSLLVTAPAGWTATVDPANANANAGQSVAFKIHLTAPAPGQGANAANLGLAASATATGGRTASASGTIALTRVDPAPLVPPDLVPYYVAASVGLLVLAAIVALILTRRRATKLALAAYLDRETGIEITLAGGPIPYGDRRETAWRVTITNASARPRVAVIETRDVPAGWRAATSLPRVPLSPSESVTLSVHVAPDAATPAGAPGAITVAARPEEARDKAATLTLDCTAPEAHPDAPGPRRGAVVVLREGNSTRPRLRT